MKNGDEDDNFLCPSAPLTKKSFLLGVLDEKAEVNYLVPIHKPQPIEK